MCTFDQYGIQTAYKLCFQGAGTMSDLTNSDVDFVIMESWDLH